MKAWWLDGGFGVDKLRVGAYERLKLKDSHVRVKFHAVALNFRDLLVVKGIYNPKLKMPVVPCSDGSGEIIEVGSEVSKFRVGDRVATTFSQSWLHGQLDEQAGRTTLGAPLDGTLRQEGIFDQFGLVPVPEFLSYEEAATLGCAGLTAFNSLTQQSQLNPGSFILIEGCGGVSIFALQFAKALGFVTIITSSSNTKLARARELGADFIINYNETPDWDKYVREITHGQGVDLVIEVGGTQTINKGINSLRCGGVSCIIGILGGTKLESDIIPILMRGIRLQGIFVGSRELFLAMNRVIEHAKIRPIVDKVFDFDQAPQAFSYLESGKHFGKVCINIK